MVVAERVETSRRARNLENLRPCKKQRVAQTRRVAENRLRLLRQIGEPPAHGFSALIASPCRIITHSFKLSRTSRRPRLDIETVGPEQGDRQPVHAEGDAGGMRRRAGLIVDAPGRAEMVAMIVEAHAGGRLLGRMQRHQQLELQRLLDLADRHHLAGAAEEGIARRLRRRRAGRVRRPAPWRAPSTCRGKR